MYHKLMLIVFIAVQSAACVFVPKTDDAQPYSSDCSMKTRKLTLTHSVINDFHCYSDHSENDIGACLIVAGAIIPAGSLIVSGSIVAIGNTIHWLEYQGMCEKGFVSKKLKHFKDKINKKA